LLGIWHCSFEWPYADKHPLALEVDVGDGELVGERHDCGGECGCVWSRKVRAHLLSVFAIVESTPPTPAILDLSRAYARCVTLTLFRSRPFGVRENTGDDHSHHGSSVSTRIIRLVKGSTGVVGAGEWREVGETKESEVGMRESSSSA
jgi:hypothetical protein